ACTREHHAAHCGIALAVSQRVQHFFVHLGNECIQRLRPIECDGRHAVFFFEYNGFVAHDCSFSLRVLRVLRGTRYFTTKNTEDTKEDYFPLNAGLRFSRKAFMPSFRSSDAKSR